MANEIQDTHAQMPAEAAHGTATGANTEVEHAQPSILGLDPTGWVSMAMIGLILVAFFMKVPKALTKSLDAKIDAIRAQLTEAETLRNEAEALRASYDAKLKSADGEAAQIRAAAEAEAQALVAKTKADSEALIARRQRMAEDKIAAAERMAIADLRAKTASAATLAAQALMVEKHDAAADAKLVDSAIGSLN